jgi:hypothetical protein
MAAGNGQRLLDGRASARPKEDARYTIAARPIFEQNTALTARANAGVLSLCVSICALAFGPVTFGAAQRAQAGVAPAVKDSVDLIENLEGQDLVLG